VIGAGLRTFLNAFGCYYTRILPAVSRCLAHWNRRADAIASLELRLQAKASLRSKRFHCEGGSFYAALVSDPDKEHVNEVIRAIVTLQTISDYLDNLCDRMGSTDGQDFRQLHLSMSDAVRPQAGIRDYYRYNAHKEDSGYLNELVSTCQQTLGRLPLYRQVQEDVLHSVRLYSNLQVYKHLARHLREQRCRGWFEEHRRHYAEIQWQEFCAATGSTLLPFALFALATRKTLAREYVERLRAAYLPWVCGLHILLDYYIDQQEDRDHGDLNFVSYYSSGAEAEQRIRFFLLRALRETWLLPDRHFHRLIVRGLVWFYLARGWPTAARWRLIRTALAHP